MIKYSPCYKCAERHELCHSDCERYKEYQELLKQQNANNRYIAEADSCLIHAIKKRIREKHERKHNGNG
jgi:hypothetical protein